jgi:tetratricopeptide (TPR) repeat protein
LEREEMTMSLYLRTILLLLSAFTMHESTGRDSDFREGIKASESGDYAKALHYMELAISGDPDNLRYASEYRQTAIRAKEFDRSLSFFEKLVSDYPRSVNLHLNYGFAYVDKIPTSGSVTQVILANNALNQFSEAFQLQPSWIVCYTRGTSYLFWPKIFNRAALGVADLEQALKIQKSEPKRSYYVRTYVALGDGYWKMDQLEKARAIWQEGLRQFPDAAALQRRLSVPRDELKSLIENGFDPNKRVDTDLRELWEDKRL